MEDYDVHIRADVVGTFIVIGTQINVHDLSKDRHFLRYRNAVTLKVSNKKLDENFVFTKEQTHLVSFTIDQPCVCHGAVREHSPWC